MEPIGKTVIRAFVVEALLADRVDLSADELGRVLLNQRDPEGVRRPITYFPGHVARWMAEFGWVPYWRQGRRWFRSGGYA